MLLLLLIVIEFNSTVVVFNIRFTFSIKFRCPIVSFNNNNDSCLDFFNSTRQLFVCFFFHFIIEVKLISTIIEKWRILLLLLRYMIPFMFDFTLHDESSPAVRNEIINQLDRINWINLKISPVPKDIYCNILMSIAFIFIKDDVDNEEFNIN